MKTSQQQDIVSLGASSFACLRGDEHGCGKQIDLQSKKNPQVVNTEVLKQGPQISLRENSQLHIHPLGPSLMTTR